MCSFCSPLVSAVWNYSPVLYKRHLKSDWFVSWPSSHGWDTVAVAH